MLTIRPDPHSVEQTITLLEALVGFELHIQHLDGRVLRVRSEKDTITKPGDIRVIEDEGMPIHGQPFRKV
jgi:DnaJ family protein A protein 2